jgi:hypothetical protein
MLSVFFAKWSVVESSRFCRRRRRRRLMVGRRVFAGWQALLLLLTMALSCSAAAVPLQSACLSAASAAPVAIQALEAWLRMFLTLAAIGLVFWSLLRPDKIESEPSPVTLD